MRYKISILFAFACLPFIAQAQQEQRKAIAGKVTTVPEVNRTETTANQQGHSKTTTSLEVETRRKVEDIRVEATRERQNVTPRAIDANGREVYSRDEDK